MAKYSAAGMCLIAVLAASSLTGCADRTGQPVLTYHPTSKIVPGTATVTKPAHYALYASDSPNPIYAVELVPGDEYGFVERGDGSVVGVAKGNDIPLPDVYAKTYTWKVLEPKPQGK